MGITLDNASNNSTFIHFLTNWSVNKSISFDSNYHFRCFAHVINLGVKEALICLEEKISKVNLLLNLFII
jgi:hypothetical protein